MLEPFKYLLQPVALERDQDGQIIREVPGETMHLYTLEQLAGAVEQWETQLGRLNMEQADGSNVAAA